MFLVVFASVVFEVLLVLTVLIILTVVASVFIVRDLRMEHRKVFKVRSRFHIELRKISNLMYKVLHEERLEPYTQVVIKKLPHEEKKILSRIVDEVFEAMDQTNEDYKYIVETYENLQQIRRERDAKVLVYNQKLRTFPFSLYGKFMKLITYKLYTDKQ